MVDIRSTEQDRAVLQSALEGDESGLARLLEGYRDRLRRMVDARLDSRLRGRIDASDVIQEAYIDVAAGLGRYLDNPGISFFLWVRYITGIKLQYLHRHHLQYQIRDARREVSPHLRRSLEASSLCLAQALIDQHPTPPEVAVAREEREWLERALDSLSPDDRELLALRHVEQLGNAEIAVLLGATVNAVNVRYSRAAKRLAERLSRIRGPQDG